MVGRFLKRQLRRSVHRVGYDLKRVQPGLVDFLVSREIDVVIDVGANSGQFAGNLRDAGYCGDIVSFEPIREIFERLKRNAQRDPKWATHNLALGAAQGRASINVTKRSEFSSFLAMAPVSTAWAREASVVGVEEVDVITVDAMFEQFEGRNVFLKIDTQGFERQVLDGARSALERLCGVQLELPIVHLYSNTWSFCEAIAYMGRAGFVISQVAPVAFHREDSVSLVEVDCVFRRRGVPD